MLRGPAGGGGGLRSLKNNMQHCHLLAIGHTSGSRCDTTTCWRRRGRIFGKSLNMQLLPGYAGLYPLCTIVPTLVQCAARPPGGVQLGDLLTKACCLPKQIMYIRLAACAGWQLGGVQVGGGG